MRTAQYAELTLRDIVRQLGHQILLGYGDGVMLLGWQTEGGIAYTVWQDRTG